MYLFQEEEERRRFEPWERIYLNLQDSRHVYVQDTLESEFPPILKDPSERNTLWPTTLDVYGASHQQIGHLGDVRKVCKSKSPGLYSSLPWPHDEQPLEYCVRTPSSTSRTTGKNHCGRRVPEPLLHLCGELKAEILEPRKSHEARAIVLLSGYVAVN
ncbi:hypothetical protein B0H17DRAFT_1147460 [Mycena rosella]|uniref:Uncharacterized protein n=1 Tax=Mycena rosella TaxID=1033263 RepID=A0AAD7G2C0_MYCRO|nr:hypothetical protein B0H17DRAFT_1147460 [Mycena rosella]